MTTETLSPPELETLRIEIDGEIGTLTLDRPEVFNAMSPEMIGELTVAFAWLADRAPLRALIVTGAGKAFCSGGDVNGFKAGVEDDSIDLPAQARTVGEPGEGDRHLEDHLRAHRVEGVGAVERQRTDLAADLDPQGLQLRRRTGAHRSLPVCVVVAIGPSRPQPTL